MSRFSDALGAGIAGTAVLSLLLLLLEVETRSAIGIFDAIARFARFPDDVGVGVAIFVAAGIVAWPLLFLAVEGWIPLDDVATRGMAFAVPLWFAFVIVSGGVDSGAVIFLPFTLLAHLAYGFTMGMVYGMLAGAEDADADPAETGTAGSDVAESEEAGPDAAESEEAE